MAARDRPFVALEQLHGIESELARHARHLLDRELTVRPPADRMLEGGGRLAGTPRRTVRDPVGQESRGSRASPGGEKFPALHHLRITGSAAAARARRDPPRAPSGPYR